ncbi:DUF7512 family protein [Natronobacterium gregoryi]|uniref:Uncharacterized protein n=2 Tax=Natronobacterium gregoryi TaxID=44930 RepID=L0AK66_NATGS|nr:hypothetical protein [Natronobacterium gregoryi]AFZ74283.1 hypothetical protein Natgr_3152 [Natronobacterium gregoryi SP2]ELY63742.1 hypothetical protein C490_15869 [Natronobacterium gregoryi SP2]SFI52948.1 hypothetical protein SAMN05443661_101171 [Natronobacterium gregoryi]
MLGIEGGVAGAVAVVGFILVQAIVLYVAYGWLESIAKTVHARTVN